MSPFSPCTSEVSQMKAGDICILSKTPSVLTAGPVSQRHTRLRTGHQQRGGQHSTCVEGSQGAGGGRDTSASFCAQQQSQNMPGEWDPARVTVLVTAQHQLFASGRNYGICLEKCLFNSSNIISSSSEMD